MMLLPALRKHQTWKNTVCFKIRYTLNIDHRKTTQVDSFNRLRIQPNPKSSPGHSPFRRQPPSSSWNCCHTKNLGKLSLGFSRSYNPNPASARDRTKHTARFMQRTFSHVSTSTTIPPTLTLQEGSLVRRVEGLWVLWFLGLTPRP